MQRLLMFAVAILTGAGGRAAEVGPRHDVCVRNRGIVDIVVMFRAQAVVTAVFADAGMHVEWLPSRECQNRAGNVVHLEMEAAVPPNVGPDTLAYAFPYAGSGTSIHIFYYRVIQNHPSEPAQLLGHVIAHEMGHVLEGVARHSTDGLMKAHWGPRDYTQMKLRHLPFAAEDVELMHVNDRKVSAAAQSARSEMH